MNNSNRCIPPRSLHGYGAFIRYFDYATDLWVTVAGTTDIPFPELTRDKTETNEDDGDGTIHYLPNPQSDVADVAITGDFIETQFVKMLNMYNSKVITCWQVVLNTPQQRYVQWCGFLTRLKGHAPKKGLVTVDFTIGTSGGGVSTGELGA